MRRRWRIGLMLAMALLSGCGGRIVIDRGGIGRERDVTITEAAQNTRMMRETTEFSEW